MISDKTQWRNWLNRSINVRPEETRAALWGFGFFFFLFSSYAALRPVRDAMGIVSGLQNMQWLFSTTFIVMLIAVPFYGWLNARVARAQFINWVYGFCILNMLGFSACLLIWPGSLWVSRIFFVWVSVFNLFVVSVAWSLMADVFSTEQAGRFFGFIASGASIGGITGPIIGAITVSIFPIHILLVVSALLLVAAIFAKSRLLAWCTLHDTIQENASRKLPVKGNPFTGFTLVLGSPYLICLAVFVILLSTASTFLYFEQAKLISITFPSHNSQIRIFSVIDSIVQTLSLICQVLITGRFAHRFGIKGLLTVVPVIVAAGFLTLAVCPAFVMVATVMAIRRIGEYAFIRPGREILFTAMPADIKYRAKSFLDTVVYRAGDAISGWIIATIAMFSQSSAIISLTGAALAFMWAGTGYILGRMNHLPQ